MSEDSNHDKRFNEARSVLNQQMRLREIDAVITAMWQGDEGTPQFDVCAASGFDGERAKVFLSGEVKFQTVPNRQA
jgi:hypothetical protein